jgi:hypothetical protein
MSNNKSEILINEFREELNKLKPAVELVKDMAVFSDEMQRNVTAVWNKSVNTIDEIKSLSEKDIDEARTRLAELSEHVASSISGMKALTETLDRADLPARLRRTEDALSTLNTSIQNIFGRIDFLELNLREEQKNHSCFPRKRWGS